MKNNIIITILLFVFLSAHIIFAQETNDSTTTTTNIAPFVTLYHQHHDFFGKAFSFQGLEGGVIIQDNIFIGLYGAFFVSNLNAEVNKEIKFIWMGQAGVEAAYIIYEQNRFHPGFQLNLGLFSLRNDDNDFGLFETEKASFKLSGIVVSPQIFGELIVTEWFKIRTGLSYNFYLFEDNSMIKSSELNYISFTFGLVFHGN